MTHTKLLENPMDLWTIVVYSVHTFARFVIQDRAGYSVHIMLLVWMREACEYLTVSWREARYEYGDCQVIRSFHLDQMCKIHPLLRSSEEHEGIGFIL